MTRHTIPNAPGSPPNRETVVGWDSPLGTYFTQCYDEPDDPRADDTIVFRYGATRCGEIPTLEQLAQILRTHDVTLPADIAHQLSIDTRTAGRR
jgi:hypothetical protein